MKKLFLALAFPALLSLTAKAQDDSESRKPETGDITTEVNLGLFNSGVTINNIVNQLRGRYFLSPTMAVRLGFNASSDIQETEASGPNNFSFKSKNTTFSISPGIEKHFAGTDRLSPYIGAEISFFTNKINQTLERETGTPKTIEYVNYRPDGNGNIGERGFNRTGINAIAGVDYYFAKHFYAGIELGYSIAFSKPKEAERLTDGRSDFKVESTSTNTNFDAYANNGIRLGFVF